MLTQKENSEFKRKQACCRPGAYYWGRFNEIISAPTAEPLYTFYLYVYTTCLLTATITN